MQPVCILKQWPAHKCPLAKPDLSWPKAMNKAEVSSLMSLRATNIGLPMTMG